MPSFKDEHILLIVPGSQTTLAQLGLPESFTPARLRISTRMFQAEQKGEWEPLKVRERKIIKTHTHNEADERTNGDITMGEANGELPDGGDKTSIVDEEETLYEEDPTTEEGAVWPIQNGKIVNWSCFFALLSHVHQTLSPPLHTPVLIVSQPVWSAHDHEILTQFCFETFKMPAFCLMDSALAACYAFSTASATVVDVGYEKCDVSTVSDFVVNDLGRGAALVACGGEAMTRRLHELLGPKGFTRDMCEQLKKNPICEILPTGTELPGEDQAEEQNVNPAVAASTGATGQAEAQADQSQGPGLDTAVGDEDQDREVKDGEDNEGVLDVASIVASGKTSEFLARKDKEKQDKAAAKKAAGEAAAANRQAKLPNSKRTKASFHYTERRPLEELNANGKRTTDGSTELNSAVKRQKTPEPVSPTFPDGAENSASARKEERRRNREAATAFVRKEVEVGVERLQATSGGILDSIADTIHRVILSLPDIQKRSELWDSLIILGNGSKVKGFKDALLATLNARYLISPSNTTMFTSELPSNFTTPVATGANTPQPQHHPPPHHGAGVNPLLLAATTASHQHQNLAPPGQSLHQQLQFQQYHNRQQELPEQPRHHQTPTSIKLAKMPDYFPEWKDVGTEEAAFLGAQVAAKVVFVVDQGLSKGFMSRTEYNEMGPQGIHESCL